MDLHNPMVDDLEKAYLEEQIDIDPPVLNQKLFLDSIKKMGYAI